MSRRRRQSYAGCSISRDEGRLRLRFRLVDADGKARQIAFRTGWKDNAENLEKLEPLRKAAGALVRAGKDPRPYLEGCFAQPTPTAETSDALLAGPTVRSYYDTWYRERVAKPKTRAAQARDYRRHMELYVLPAIGDLPLAALRPKDVRGLQADLTTRVSAKTHKPLSEKFVKNILLGTFRAMIRQARSDELVMCDPFVGLEWEPWEYPEPNPFEPEERDAILGYFAEKRFSFHAGRGTQHRMLPHPHYHAYLHFLFWHGARPSEASGLRWGDVNLAGGVVHIRRSFHMGRYGKPKTQAARRTIELHPETVRLLRALRPLRETPTSPVFVTTEGKPIEPKTFSSHWHDCLRLLYIQQRGLYCTKDTFVSLTLATGRDDVLVWLVEQTGVAIQTLRAHYAKLIPKQTKSLRMWGRLDPSLKAKPAREVA